MNVYVPKMTEANEEINAHIQQSITQAVVDYSTARTRYLTLGLQVRSRIDPEGIRKEFATTEFQHGFLEDGSLDLDAVRFQSILEKQLGQMYSECLKAAITHAGGLPDNNNNNKKKSLLDKRKEHIMEADNQLKSCMALVRENVGKIYDWMLEKKDLIKEVAQEQQDAYSKTLAVPEEEEEEEEPFDSTMLRFGLRHGENEEDEEEEEEETPIFANPLNGKNLDATPTSSSSSSTSSTMKTPAKPVTPPPMVRLTDAMIRSSEPPPSREEVLRNVSKPTPESNPDVVIHHKSKKRPSSEAPVIIQSRRPAPEPPIITRVNKNSNPRTSSSSSSSTNNDSNNNYPRGAPDAMIAGPDEVVEAHPLGI
jgi:hypothetical protein